MNEQIEIFLKQIELQADEILVCKIMDYIYKCNANEITGLEQKIASLFCRSIACLSQDTITETVKESIIAAFDNIKTMANNSKGTSELRTIYLLNQVYKKDTKAEYDEVVEEEFGDLLDNLERIRILFKLFDEEQKEIFPIRALLFNLINSDNLMRDIKEVKTIQALMLALQIFDRNKYPQELEDIKNIVSENGLRFIEYLFENAQRLGGDDWKKNYEKNGTLVLYDIHKNTILIRNIYKDYFCVSREILNDYKCSSILEEKNEEGLVVGYYVEYSVDNFSITDLKTEFEMSNNKKSILQIIEIIYGKKYYNILFQQSLFKDTRGIVKPVNPFGGNDKYTIIDGNSVDDGISEVSKYLKIYGLITLSGKGIDIVNLGMVVCLEMIFYVKIDELGLNNNITFNELLTNWIKNCLDKKDSFNRFLKEYNEGIKYVFNKKSLYNKEFKNDYFMPYPIDEKILNVLEFNRTITSFQVAVFKTETDFFDDTIRIIKKDDQRDFSNYTLQFLDQDEMENVSDDLIACIDEKKQILYTGIELKYYNQLRNKILQINKNTLNINMIKKLNENHINEIKKMMLCFDEVFRKIHPRIKMEDIVRYRIAHHLLLLDMKENIFVEWYNLLKSHEIINYSIVNSLPYEDESGILYIPKDREKAQSTFRYIYNRYILSKSKRNKTYIYDINIQKKIDGYYINNKKIKKIIFLFDLIQKGKATKNTINYYLDKNNIEDNLHMNFYCNDKRINISEILKANTDCEVVIYSIYGSMEGIEKIREYMNIKMKNRKYTIKEPLKYISCKLSEEDNELYRNFISNFRLSA